MTINYALQKLNSTNVNLLIIVLRNKIRLHFICTLGKICKLESHCIGRNWPLPCTQRMCMNRLGNHPLMSESLQQGGIPYGKKWRMHGLLRIGAWHVVPLITKKKLNQVCDFYARDSL